MRIDKLKQYVSLRQDLADEKRQIEARLGEINEALSDAGTAKPAAARRGRPPGVSQRRPRQGKRAKNEMSLKEAVVRVTKARPLSKKEILAAVAKAGYEFTAKAPINSLNTLLYGNKGLKNHGGGKFGPA